MASCSWGMTSGRITRTAHLEGHVPPSAYLHRGITKSGTSHEPGPSHIKPAVGRHDELGSQDSRLSITQVFSSIFIKMEPLSNSSIPDPKAEVVSSLANVVQDLSFVYAAGAVVLTALLLSGFGAGRKILNRILWFFDRMLGGAPHTVSLPSPPGLPIVGNLLEVSTIST